MKHLFLYFLFLGPHITVWAQNQAQPEAPHIEVSAKQKAETDEVLFIGNSYTYVNGLPDMVGAMLSSKVKNVKVGMVAKGAYSLDAHWTDEGAKSPREVIGKEKWDAVVLQDQSGRPAMDPEGTIADVVRFEKLIHAKGARTILFMTWGHADDSFKEMSKIIALTYSRAAVKSGAEIAPVGLAWFQAIQKDAKLVLHSPDGSHPNVKGTYLAACVIYATLTGRSPVGLPGTLKAKGDRLICQLSDSDARWLQQVAFDSVQSFKNIDAAKALIASHEKTLQKWENFEGKLHQGLTPEAVVETYGKPHAASNNDGKIIQVYRLVGEKELWLIYSKDRKLERASFQPDEGVIPLPAAP